MTTNDGWTALTAACVMVAISGCALLHEREGRASPEDAGSPSVPDTSLATPGPMRDAASLDARVDPPPSRPIDGTTYVCHPATGADTSTRVDVYVERDCPCGETLRCRFERGDEPSTLRLLTEIEIDDPLPLCEACDPEPVFLQTLRASCELPALRSGTWQVFVDDDRVFDIAVGDAAPASVGDRCVRLAEPIPRIPEEWPGTPNVISVCGTEANVSYTPALVRIEHTCLDCCSARATCDVTILRDGERDTVVVRPLFNYGYALCPADCAGCVGTSFTDCRIPKLPDGRYPLSIEGAAGSGFELIIGPGAASGGVPVCSDGA